MNILYINACVRKDSRTKASSKLALSKLQGNIEEKEMYNVFNMGIGFMLAVDKNDVEDVMNKLKAINEEAYIINCEMGHGVVAYRYWNRYFGLPVRPVKD